VERVGRLPPKGLRGDVPLVPIHVLRDMGRLSAVCSRSVRRLRSSVHGVCYLRLRLVVPMGCRVLRPVT
jgi:hypothetical protein